MPLADRIRAFFARPSAEKAATTATPYATSTMSSAQIWTAQRTLRRGVKELRNFADRNEAVRTAINWRKQQISQAEFKIVRLDDPKRPPDERIVKAVSALLRNVNTKRESLRSLLDMVIEDLLVLDAGCVEKEKTLGGQIAALWAVDGSTIAPDPDWDGRDPQAVRYRQFIGGILKAQLRNDQLIYMMQTPTTHRILGLSPVETLVNVIEAELFGENFDFETLKRSAPPGLLHLGPGLDAAQVEAFKAYYSSEIEGTPRVAITGGGGVDGAGKPLAGVPTFTKFGFSPEELQREQYKTWLIKKIAFVFQMDPTIFGITGDVNRATAKQLGARTDQGFVALANLVAEYLTRELVWEFDENHGFAFTDLTFRDPKAEAEVDLIRMQAGTTTPNEIRARDGEDPVPWGDFPYVYNSTQSPSPLYQATQAPPPDATPPSDNAPKNEAAKRARPFAGARTTRATTEPTTRP